MMYGRVSHSAVPTHTFYLPHIFSLPDLPTVSLDAVLPSFLTPLTSCRTPHSIKLYFTTLHPPTLYVNQCELQKSTFKEDVALHMDRSGHLVGLHLTSPVIALPRACDPRKAREGREKWLSE